MTTTSHDNHHGDQDDMRGEDLPPHLNHPGTENQEDPDEFHKNAVYLAAICEFELRFRATTERRVAIWEIA